MDKVRRQIVKYKGINTDIEPMELLDVPVWTGGTNVIFDDGSTERVRGYGRFADPLPTVPEQAMPVFQHPVLTPQDAFWIYISDDGTTCRCWVTNGGTHWDITPAGGLTSGGSELIDRAGHWTATTLNGLPVLNNGLDQPFWWDGQTGNPCQLLPDWPVDQRCRSIRAFKFHLIALNLTRGGVDFPHMLAWSSAAPAGSVPEEWTPTAANDAGDVSLSEELGGIVDAQPLRDKLYIFRQHSTAMASYIAGNYVFAFRELFNTSGIQSVNCAVEIRGRLYVLTDDDLIMTDGNQFMTIADNVIRDRVFSSIRPENHHLCHVCGRTDRDEVWFIAPNVDATLLNVAIVWSLQDEVFGVRGLPEVAYVVNGIIPNDDFDGTWDGAIPIWQDDPRRWNDANYSITLDGLLMSDPQQYRLLHVDALNSNDGDPVVANVERLHHTVGGEGEIWDNTLIRSIWPNITGTPGDVVYCRIGGSVSPDHPIQWGAIIPYTIDSDVLPKIDSMVHGRFLSMRFSSDGGDPWQLHRVGIEYVPLALY